jgi:hypothetical protein
VINFLFWNVNGKALGGLAAALADEHELDVMLIAECDRPPKFLEELNRPLTRQFNYHVLNPERRIEVFSRFPLQSMRLLGDEGGLSFMSLLPPIGKALLVVGVHLPSKMFRSSTDQDFHCVDVARAIEFYEERAGHRRTVIVGDFNMNPFEAGVVAASGLHAVMSRGTAGRGSRRVDGKEYQFFYNPMWNHFGDREPSPPGTYYYDNSSRTNFFWNMFDQVLVRPELLDEFDDESLRVLTTAGRVSLLASSGRPDREIASDHLPIIFSINDERSYGYSN